MNKSDRDEFDRKVLTYLRAKGTVNVNRVAGHMECKWETAERSLKRLNGKSLAFYHPDMHLWSIWPDHASPRYFEDGQHTQKRETEGNSHEYYVRLFPEDGSTVRGDVGQIVEKRGFLCHPSMKGHDIPRTFVRGHLHGQYLVTIKTIGTMPETFAMKEEGITGGWTVSKMNGNQCYFGHIRTPDDPKDWKFHAMTDKDGQLSKLSVYVHPRYIYYKDNPEIASIEFRNQVRDVCRILQCYGWEFSEIVQRGTYSMALNDPILAGHMPVNHVETGSDSVIYDSSPMTSEGGCTEAEVLYRDATDEERMNLLVELPDRHLNLENRVASMSSRLSSLDQSIQSMTSILESAIPHMANLTKTVSDLAQATELNTSVIFGQGFVPSNQSPSYIAHQNKEDVMYG